MEIIKLKKEQTLVAKLMLVLMIIFSPSYFYGQNLQGNYQQLDPLLSAKDIGVIYRFEGRKFTIIETGHLNYKDVNEGSFYLHKDTLVLDYNKRIINEDLPSIKFLRKEKLATKDKLESNIALDSNLSKNKPVVILTLESKDKTPVISFMSDNKGEFPKINLYDKYVKFFKFSFLSMRELIIDSETLFGHKTDLKIVLDESLKNIRDTNITKKYIIKRSTSSSDEIRLISIQDKSKIVRLQKITM